MKMNLIYKDTSTGEQWLLCKLETNMSFTLDEMMKNAELTQEEIENKLGFEIDYENLSVEIEKEKEIKKMTNNKIIRKALKALIKDSRLQLEQEIDYYYSDSDKGNPKSLKRAFEINKEIFLAKQSLTEVEKLIVAEKSNN